MNTCPKCGKENCQCGETCECEPVIDENKYTESSEEDADEIPF